MVIYHHFRVSGEKIIENKREFLCKVHGGLLQMVPLLLEQMHQIY